MKNIFIALFLFLNCSFSFAEKRIALVVGNSTYKFTSPLSNPKNDAADITAKLKKLGFEVIEGIDLDKRGFDEKLATFGRQVQDSDVALFYYAGHGMQHAGQNYLMPIDAQIKDEFSLRFEMTRMDDVTNVINSSRSGVKIVVLDACRDNPLALKLATSGTRSAVGRGLAPIEKTTGMVVAYATQAHQVAQDGDGRNSPFTTSFLSFIDEDNLEVGTFFRRVAGDVFRKTKGTQTPELSVSMLGEFYFKKSETDAQVWSQLRASPTEDGLNSFIKRFPNSPYADAAQSRLNILERERKDVDKSKELAEAQRKQREEAARLRAEREKMLRAELDKLSKESSDVSEPVVPLIVAGAVAGAAVAAKITEAPTRSPPAIAQPLQTATLITPPLKEIEKPPAQTIPAPPVIEIKAELKRLGCFFGKNDTKWDNKSTKLSLSAYSKELKLDESSLKPTHEFLNSLKERTSRVCPIQCDITEIKKGDKCVTKTCRKGFELTDDGDCEKIFVEPIKPKVKQAAPKAPQQKAAPAVDLRVSCARKYGINPNNSFATGRAFHLIDACMRAGG